MMKITSILSIVIIVIIINNYKLGAEINNISEIVKKIYYEAHRDSIAWDRMAEMCDRFGPRLTGSENLNNALLWAKNKMIADGLSNVNLDTFSLPSWIRGNEYCKLIQPWNSPLEMLSLGGSVGTNGKIIKAKIIPIKSKEELDLRKDEIKGNVVLYDEPYKSYGNNVQYRIWGAVWAAKYGAIASAMRPVSPKSTQNPHTGVMRYVDTVEKIPHFSLTDEACNLIRRLYSRGIYCEIEFTLDAKEGQNRQSGNLMAELIGNDLKNEIVAFGGHSDSWDAGIGSGAHDDASACIATWEALKILKKLGLKTKRTIRTVMWADEEYRQTGGKKYAEKHGKEPHFGLFESDAGCFTPNAIGFSGSDTLFNKLKEYEKYFLIVDSSFSIRKGGGGVDIRAMQELGYPVMGLGTKNDNYFLYHHSPMDVPESVNPKELNDCVATIAILMYIYANL